MKQAFYIKSIEKSTIKICDELSCVKKIIYFTSEGWTIIKPNL